MHLLDTESIGMRRALERWAYFACTPLRLPCCRSPASSGEEQAYLSWQGQTLLVVKRDAGLGLYPWNVKELVDVDTQETRWQAPHDKRDELEEILLKAQRVQPTLAAACAAFLRSAAKDMAVSEENERSESETKRLDCQIVLLRNDIRAALTPTPLKKKFSDRTPLDAATRTARTLNLAETPIPGAASAAVASPAEEGAGSDTRAIETPGSIFGDWVGAGSGCAEVDEDTARDELRELSILWSEGSVAGGGDGFGGAAGGDGASVASGGGASSVNLSQNQTDRCPHSGIPGGLNHTIVGAGADVRVGGGSDGEEGAGGVSVMLKGVVRLRELEDALAASWSEVASLKGIEKEQQVKSKVSSV